MFSKQSYSWGTFLVLVFKKLQDWKKSLEKFQPILLVYTKQTEAQHKCQPKLLRSKHLTACTAKAVLTLTPSSALNHTCTRQPVCPGEALQLNDLLLGTDVPQAVLTKQSPRAGTHSPGKPCWSSPSPCSILLHLESHLGSVVDQGSRGGLRAPLRTQQELELPILPCLLQKQQQWPSSPRLGRRVQQLLLLQGWLGGQSGTQKPRFSPCSCCG